MTAVAKGETLVTVTSLDGKIQKSCKVIVTEYIVPVTDISLNKTELSLYLNDTETLKATVHPDNATNKELLWISENPDIVSVDALGNLHALKEGETIITVKAKNYDISTSCHVTVDIPLIKVTSISLDKEEVSMSIGEKVKLKATIKPDNASNKEVIWKSLNDNIAAVTQEGEVSAIKAGSTIIEVVSQDSNYSAKCFISVTDNIVHVTSLSFNKEFLSLRLGESERLQVSIKPNNATNQNVLWSSSNDAIASVDNNGNVHALSAGSATIIGKSADNEDIKSTCEVVVLNEFVNEGMTYRIEEDHTMTLIQGCDKEMVRIEEEIIINDVTYTVIEIGEMAFELCSKVKTVYIPHSIAKIGVMAFEDCGSIRDVYIDSPLPPTYTNKCFSTGTIQFGTLHVPQGCLSQYKSAFGWDAFGLISDGEITSNGKIELDSTTIKTTDSAIVINIDKANIVSIYNLNGLLIVQKGIFKGKTSIFLPSGFYIVKIGMLVQKIVIN